MHGNNGRTAMTMQGFIGVPLREGGAVRPSQNRWFAALSGLRDSEYDAGLKSLRQLTVPRDSPSFHRGPSDQ
jgi:hypothetical protein